MSNLQSKRMAKSGTRFLAPRAVLDIGCAKITCIIAKADAENPHRYHILGSGKQKSRGFTGGVITDLEGLERSIRIAIEDAEREAGHAITGLTLGITGPHVTCQWQTASLNLSNREISQKDIRCIQDEALSNIDKKSTEILSAWPVSYQVDEQTGIRDPSGMIAKTFKIQMSVVTIPRSILRNIIECISRIHVNVDRLVPSAIASGAGALIEDEMQYGAICIDMGAGVTAVSVYTNGGPAWLETIPVGGERVTRDLTQGIGTTFAAAERMKTLHGSCHFGQPGLNEKIEAARLDDQGRLQAAQMTRAQLADIITPRVEELFELVRDRLNAANLGPNMPQRVVLTGGASQLTGVSEIAKRILNAPVRLGKPVLSDFLGDALATPAFATGTGLLLYPELGFVDVGWAGPSSTQTGTKSRDNLVKQVFRWMRENF